MKRKKHSKRNKCPSCGKNGKVRKNRSYVVFICSCGRTETAPDMETLRGLLKGNVILNISKEKEAMEEEEEEMIERKCQHPNHPSYNIRKDGRCPKAHKCPDYHSEGCVAV